MTRYININRTNRTILDISLLFIFFQIAKEMFVENIDEEILSAFASIESGLKRRRLASDIFLIRIACGGQGSPQEIPVKRAVAIFVTNLSRKGIEVKIEKKDPGWVHHDGPEAYVDWLLESDFHIVSTHIHQGQSV